MPNRVTTVTHPDGTVDKRTSQGRTYTHAVVVGPGTPESIAAGWRAQAATARGTAAMIRAAIEKGVVHKRSRGYRMDDSVVSYVYDLAGTEVQGQRSHTYALVSERGTSDGRSQCAPQYLRPGDVVVGDSAAVAGGFPNYVLVETRAHVLAQAAEEAERYERSAEKCEARAQAAERGEGLGSYGVVRWSSRRDLAERAAVGEYGSVAAAGHRVYVVPVDEPPA